MPHRHHGYRYRPLLPLRAACCLLPGGCCMAWVALFLLGGLALLMTLLSHL